MPVHDIEDNAKPRTARGSTTGGPGGRRFVQTPSQLQPTPSVARVQENVVAELLRARRPNVRNDAVPRALDAIASDDVAMSMPTDVEPENPELSALELETIVEALRNNVLFSYMRDHQLAALARRMRVESIEPGQRVIALGDLGEDFFVVRSGKFEVLDGHGEVINRLSSGATFGELGLLYSAKRTATVLANDRTRGSLYALSGKFYRYIAAQESMGAFQATVEILRSVKLFGALNMDQLTLVADSIQVLQYRAGDVIIHKGESGSVLYIIHTGTVVCTEIGSGSGTSAPVELYEGDYFGEKALLSAEPRSATVVAKSDVRLLALDQQIFRSILDPLQGIIDATGIWRTLSHTPWLRSVSVHWQRHLVEKARMERFEPGQIILREGDEGDAMYIIKDGNVSVLKHIASNVTECAGKLDSPRPAEDESLEPSSTSPGVRRTQSWFIRTKAPQLSTLGPRGSFIDRLSRKDNVEVGRLSAGDTFGEMALVGHTQRATTVVAIGRVECLVLEKGDLDPILQYVKREIEKHARERTARTELRCFAESLSLDALEKQQTIGAGSYGMVYIAKHRPTGRFVAVKEMWKAKLEREQQVTHIRNERQLLETMDSPFILKYFTSFQDERKIYFVTEVLPGGELFQRIVTPSGMPIRLNPSAAQFYLGCCIEALGHMHARNVAYRDLKPENVLLDGRGYAKLVDFGFAKKLRGKTFTLCGTPEYLAPEIILGIGHGIHVDTWGLGVLSYELVTGRSPFSARDGDHLAICRNILQERISFKDDADPLWKSLVLALLHKNPQRRPSLTSRATDDVRDSPWFQGFDWDALTHGTMKAPWSPDLRDDSDARYFTPVPPEQLKEAASWRGIEPTWVWDGF